MADKLKKIILEIYFDFFFYFRENYSRRVRKSTNKKIWLKIVNLPVCLAMFKYMYIHGWMIKLSKTQELYSRILKLQYEYV